MVTKSQINFISSLVSINLGLRQLLELKSPMQSHSLKLRRFKFTLLTN